MLNVLTILCLFRLQEVFVSGQFTCSDPDWSLFGANCYKIESKFNYADATQKCHDFGGYVIMPKTEVEMNYFKNLRNVIAEEVWIGLKEINSNGIWIWADGSLSDQGIVIDADDFADCARLKDDGNVWDIHCSNIFRTICQRDANPEASTKVSTTKESVSSTDSETKFVPENLSTTLKVSYHVSPVYSKTTTQHVSTALKVSTHLSSVVSNISTKNPQTPIPTTKYTDTATSQTLYTQSNRITPTTISSPIGKSNCSKSSTNSCRCQKRTIANTSEDQEMQNLKVTDYIWLNQCALQPLIDSGMVDVANCPYECSPKGSLTSQEDMFACVRRP